MILDNMFYNNTLIGTAMNASILRDNVINNNIANAEVPGFKKSAVEFESILQSELNKAKSTGVVDLGKLRGEIYKINSNYSYRLDGNNVDIEVEMAELYKNSVKYDVMTNSLMNNYKRINLVLSSR